jgi:hypothetical protein
MVSISASDMRPSAADISTMVVISAAWRSRRSDMEAPAW